MPTYKPQLGPGPEQTFTATVLSIEDVEGVPLVAFGDFAADDTPIHSLILALDDDDPTIELNDQLNQRAIADIERCELGDTHFRVVFKPGKEPRAGRVTLAEELEIFDVDDFEPLALRSVCVDLKNVSAQLPALRAALATLLTPAV